jgi:hypothetical protein
MKHLRDTREMGYWAGRWFSVSKGLQPIQRKALDHQVRRGSVPPVPKDLL